MERNQKRRQRPNIMASEAVSIIAVNAGDIASYNQAKYLLEKLPWIELDNIEGKPAYKLNTIRMWFFSDGILFEDAIDSRWHRHTGEDVGKSYSPQDTLQQAVSHHLRFILLVFLTFRKPRHHRLVEKRDLLHRHLRGCRLGGRCYNNMCPEQNWKTTSN